MSVGREFQCDEILGKKEFKTLRYGNDGVPVSVGSCVTVSGAVRRSRSVLNGCFRKINEIMNKLVQIAKSCNVLLVLPATRTFPQH